MSDAEDVEKIRERKREGPSAGGDSADEPVDVESGEHLDELLEERPVVLVDFYADWCGTCKMLAPTVAETAAETDATVLKVDIDAYQDLATEYRIQGEPTLYPFTDGGVEERMVGLQDKATIVEKVE